MVLHNYNYYNYYNITDTHHILIYDDHTLHCLYLCVHTFTTYLTLLLLLFDIVSTVLFYKLHCHVDNTQYYSI